MLILAVFLAANPHPDLWLDDAAFAARYCPDELSLHAASTDLLARLASRVPEVPAGAPRQLLVKQVRDWEHQTTDAADPAPPGGRRVAVPPPGRPRLPTPGPARPAHQRQPLTRPVTATSRLRGVPGPRSPG